MSEDAKRLIQAIDDYKQASSKKEYTLELEEQMRLQREIEILQRHIDLLIDYELKKRG